MAKEIERKFLVTGDFEPYVIERRHISQGYLSTDPDRTVRVRIKGDKAYLTIKTRNKGCVRGEWEYEIPFGDASELLQACTCTIEKTRCIIDAGKGLQWEVDIFGGRLNGLIVAEIELPNSSTPFERPAWLGREVTGDSRYYNSSLASEEVDIASLIRG